MFGEPSRLKRRGKLQLQHRSLKNPTGKPRIGCPRTS